MLLREARTVSPEMSWCAPTLCRPLHELAELQGLEKRGVKSTLVTETFSMVSSASADTPVPVTVKAIDPAVYPLYGKLTMDPPGSAPNAAHTRFRRSLRRFRIRMKVSSAIPCASAHRATSITALVVSEPDRLIGGPGLRSASADVPRRAESLRTHRARQPRPGTLSLPVAARDQPSLSFATS